MSAKSILLFFLIFFVLANLDFSDALAQTSQAPAMDIKKADIPKEAEKQPEAVAQPKAAGTAGATQPAAAVDKPDQPAPAPAAAQTPQGARVNPDQEALSPEAQRLRQEPLKINLKQRKPVDIKSYDEIIRLTGMYTFDVLAISFIKDDLYALLGKNYIVLKTFANVCDPIRLDREGNITAVSFKNKNRDNHMAVLQVSPQGHLYVSLLNGDNLSYFTNDRTKLKEMPEGVKQSFADRKYKFKAMQ